MLALALACSLAPTVTYDRPMSTVTEVLETLAKESGKKVEHTGIGHLPILIQVKDAPLPDLLARIAKVTDADLSETPQGFRLVRSPGRVQMARRLEAAEMAVRLKDAIAKRKADWSSAEDWSDQAIQEKADRLVTRLEPTIKNLRQTPGSYSEVMIGNIMETPVSLILAKLLTSVPAPTWVPETPGSIVRLSDQPNRYQRKLPIDLSAEYAKFAQAHNRMRALVNARLPLENVGVGFEERDLSPSDIARTVVLVDWNREEWVSLTVFLTDRSGNVLSKVTTSFTMTPAAAAVGSEFTSETVVPIAPAATALAKAMNVAPSRGGMNRSMSMRFDDIEVSLGRSIKTPLQPNEVLDRLCADLDPMEDVAGASLRTAAKEESKNLVALLPQALFKPSFDLARKEKVTVRDFGGVLHGTDVQVVRDGDWMTARPRLSAMIDRDLVNRKALAKLSRALRSQGFASLDQLSEYMGTRLGRIQADSMDHLWIRVLSAVEAENFMQDQDGLRFYASLPMAIKNQKTYRAAVDGTLLPMVGNRLDSHMGGARVFGEGVAVMTSNQRPNRWIGNVDVSESLATGQMQFVMNTTEANTLYGQRGKEAGGKFVRPAELGVYRIYAKKAEYADFNSEFIPFDSYQKATSRRIQLQIQASAPGQSTPGQAGAGMLVVDELEDNKLVPGGGKWTWETLPVEIKNEILDAEKRYADRIGG